MNPGVECALPPMGSWQDEQLNTHVPETATQTSGDEAVRRHEQRVARLQVSRRATRAEAECEVAAALAYRESLQEEDLVSMEARN